MRTRIVVVVALLLVAACVSGKGLDAASTVTAREPKTSTQPAPATTPDLSTASTTRTTAPLVLGPLLGCSEFSLAQVSPSTRFFLEAGGLVVDTGEARFRLNQADRICRTNPDAVEILQSSGAWTFDDPAKIELDCSDYDATVLTEHNNFFNNGQVLFIDNNRATYVLDPTSEACLNNPDAVAVLRSEALLPQSSN